MGDTTFIKDGLDVIVKFTKSVGGEKTDFYYILNIPNSILGNKAGDESETTMKVVKDGLSVIENHVADEKSLENIKFLKSTVGTELIVDNTIDSIEIVCNLGETESAE